MSGKWWPQEMMIPHKSEFLSTFLIVHAESFLYWYFNALDLYFLIPFVGFFGFFFKGIPLFLFFIYLFIYFWLCWVFVSAWGLSLVVASGGRSSSRCAGLSLSRPLLLRSTGSRRTGSVVVAHGPGCSAACGIFPDQGSNPCPLHWQADSQPLRHQGSPPFVLSKEILWSRYCLLFLTKYKDPQSHYSFKDSSFNEAGAVMSTYRLLSFKKILSGPYLCWEERTTELPVSETFVCLIQQLLSFPTCLRQAAQLWLLR